MIIIKCDRCDRTIDDRLESYETLVTVSNGQTGLHNLIYGGTGEKPMVIAVGQYCKDCSRELPTYKLKREIKKLKDDK